MKTALRLKRLDTFGRLSNILQEDNSCKFLFVVCVPDYRNIYETATITKHSLSKLPEEEGMRNK